MSVFKMCPDCQREYEDPFDRRFHAQPNACPVCGPRLQLTDNHGVNLETGDIIEKTAQLLKEGRIIAIKGLGGFLLACNAENAGAVDLLRQRKRRPSKPFAVMLKDMRSVQEHCEVTPEEEMLLRSPQSPIALLRWKPSSRICRGVAPDLKFLGVMLPYTPLHHLILRQVDLPLVMTSGNISEEPIAGQNAEALDRLGDIADYFLLHDRDIYSTYDDSVTLVAGDQPQILRRARGYAPYPIHLKFAVPQILACGAEEKNTFCLTRDNHAFVSQHIGDMENIETLEHYERTVELYRKLFRIRPEIIAYDLHPEYLPTKYALEQIDKSGLRGTGVQHHHAHIASCLADNRFEEKVIGVAFDGTGYGSDGHIWGGEFLIADCRDFQRVGQLEYQPLPGGALAIKRPYRIALGYLVKLMGDAAFDQKLDSLNSVDGQEIELVKKQVVAGINSPLTSSMGRLFDSVSALTGICSVIDYEAQAAIEMEMKAYNSPEEQGAYPFSIVSRDGYHTVMLREIMSGVVHDIITGIPASVIAMRFHNTIARLALEVCLKIKRQSGLDTVALSGGCFQNRLLLVKTLHLLSSADFKVLIHRQVPANDGGISLGQAVIAAHTL
jgi:hydrogenase maturation protein HypF